MIRYRLFSTDGCHLCDQAWDLLARAGYAAWVEKVDIIDTPEWLERYRFTIPVLRHIDSGRELGWPFDEAALKQFMGNN